MTCITSHLTKKSLKDAIAQGEDPAIEDPSIVAPFSGLLSKYLAEHGECYVTNHPKRSWFARITQKDGRVKVE